MQKKLKKTKTALTKFRSERHTELLELAQALERNAICTDPTPIKQAAEDCAGNQGRHAEQWGYDLNNLEFQINTPRNTMPATIGDQLTLRLSISLLCLCTDETHDPFQSLEFNIELFDSPPPPCKSYISWHFDRHIEDPASAEPDELHPLYHFQHGGHRTHANVADSLGKLLLLAPPRLPHPPMDAILAVDFVLANFKGNSWRKLRDAPEYKRLVINAQRRFWKPYMDLLGAAFVGEGPKQTDPIFSIWPSFISARAKHDKLVIA